MKSFSIAGIILSFLFASPARVACRLVGGAKGRKLQENTAGAHTTDNQYLILFANTVTNATAKAEELTKLTFNGTYQELLDGGGRTEGGAHLLFTYQAAFKGATLQNVTKGLLAHLEQDPHILSIRQTTNFHFGSDLSSTKATQTQENVTSWALDRLDQNSTVRNGLYRYKYTGQGVKIYVLDSGIRLTHQEFAGRNILCGNDYVLGLESDIPCDDLFGHGTFVSSEIVGNTVGLAKDATLEMLKVGGKPSPEVPPVDEAAVYSALDYVMTQKLTNPETPMVVSMSIVADYVPTLNQAVNKLVRAGVTVVVAAGNTNSDPCSGPRKQSPASAKMAITVGSTTSEDRVANSSNFGPCVTMYAPGDFVLGAWRNNDTEYKQVGGTSFAAPFVAGVAAMHLEKSPTLTPGQLERKITADALKGVLITPKDPANNNLVNTEALLKKGK